MENEVRGKVIQNIAKMVSLREKIKGLVPYEKSYNYSDYSDYSYEPAPELPRSEPTVQIKRRNETMFKPRNSSFRGPGNFGAYGV